MNWFYSFFGAASHTKAVEVVGGKFQLGPLSTTAAEVLWFVKFDIAQATVAEDHPLGIAPFGTTGIACHVDFPASRNVRLFFFEQDTLWREDGYFIDQNRLVYLYKDTLRLATRDGDDHLLLDRHALHRIGYCGSITFDTDRFCVPSKQPALIPYDFYDYEGRPLPAYKDKQVANKIMLLLRSFVAKDCVKSDENSPHRQLLTDLTWQATSATVSDVRRLLALERDADNLSWPHAQKVLSVIACFTEMGKPQWFPRYMELFFTAYLQLSRMDEWLRCQWGGEEGAERMLEEHHNAVYQKMYMQMDSMARELTAREDFESLLADYPRFETATRQFVGLE